ncbi:uncharacterized protein FIESC28_01088 [Fusarium coffeatum]|uniref:Protein kinase domain-containing protein n=1 Tax=Fusarium coffeatum TaxID=231269 RepID=A0A366SBG5_9HYPO|nr:uncharacterized protein FIESC28_01088 [Fusarium coffeatum]RBR26060.1 hypothetical protein FIESC28_01088 [Fusarium coffeatum]
MALSFRTPSTLAISSRAEEDKKNEPEISTTALDFVSALTTSKFLILGSGLLRLDDITVRVAGRGGYASIEIGTAKLPHKRLVAVKRSLIKSDQRLNGPTASGKGLGKGFEQIVRELRILGHDSIKKHNNLVNLEGVCLDDYNGFPSLAIVMEYSSLGTLRAFLTENAKNISLGERVDFVMQSGRGLEALHQVKVCHADIKIDNALVFKSSTHKDVASGWTIRLSDFGQSIIASRDDPDGRVYCRPGTPLLEAPEIRSGQSFSDGDFNIHAALKTDVFSFGLFIWEAMNKGRLYFDPAWIESSDRPLDINMMESFLDGLPENGLLSRAIAFAKGLGQEEIADLLSRLFEVTLIDDPKARKSIGDLMELFPQNEKHVDSDTDSDSSIDIEAILVTLGLENDHFPTSSIVSWGTRNSFYDLDLQGIVLGNGIIASLPVSLQRSILAELKAMADLSQDNAAGHSAMTVSECYTIGFGGSHDMGQVLHWLAAAASKGFHKACLLYHRVCSGLRLPPRDVDGTDEGKALDLALRSLPTEKYLSERIIHHSRMIIESARNAMLQIAPVNTRMGTCSLSLFNETDIDTLQPLHVASWLGDESLVLQLLESGPQDTRSQLGLNAIHFACLGGSLSVLKLLIERGLPPSVADFRSITPLHLAIFFTSKDLPAAVQLLIQSGCSVEARANSVNFEAHDLLLSGTPIEWAIGSRNITFVRLLLTHHVQPPDPVWLHIAIVDYYWEILEDLLPLFLPTAIALPDSHATLHVAQRPFLHWIAHGKDYHEAIKGTVQICSDNGLLSCSTDGTSYLSLLIDDLRTEGDFAMFNAALDVSTPEDVRKRRAGFLDDPLIVSAFQHNAQKDAFRDILIKLTGYYTLDELEDGRMCRGGSLLGQAVEHDNVMGARILLEKGVDVNKTFVIGGIILTNPIQECLASRSSPEMLSLLVQYGADLLAKSPMTGLTPLHALLTGRMQVKDILDILSHHQQPDQVFIEALHRSFGTLLILSMRYEAGMSSNERDSKSFRLRNDLQEQFCQLLRDSRFSKFIDAPQHEDGPTMLQQAAYLAQPFLVSLLLEAGADGTRRLKRDDDMVLPLDLACMTGRGLYAAKVAGIDSTEGFAHLSIDDALEVATDLLQWHLARNDGIFEGTTQLHLASRIFHEEAMAKFIQQGQSMMAKGRWPGVEYTVTPRELALLPVHDKEVVSYADLIPQFRDELLGEEAMELVRESLQDRRSSEDSSSVDTEDLEY